MNQFQRCPIKAVSQRVVVKGLGANRVGGYMMLWGDEDHKDLDGEFFTPETEDLTTLFDAMGRLPFLYNHAMDRQLKSSVVGYIDVLKPDELGMWYEAQLEQGNAYLAAIQKLIAQRALGTSSGTLPGAKRTAKNGQILRWATVEGSLTPQPADPRQLERPVSEVKSAFLQIGIRPRDLNAALRSRERAAKLGLLDLLAMEGDNL